MPIKDQSVPQCSLPASSLRKSPRRLKSRATEITTSRRGDVTNARDKQKAPLVLCSFQIIEPAVAVIAGALDFKYISTLRIV